MLSNAESNRTKPSISSSYQPPQPSDAKIKHKTCKRIKKYSGNAKENNLHRNSIYSTPSTSPNKALSTYVLSKDPTADSKTKKPSVLKTKKIMSNSLQKNMKQSESSYYSTDGTVPQEAKSAVFTSSGRISAKRETPDGAADDEGIASAIPKETDAPDGRLYAGRKLTEEVNTAAKSPKQSSVSGAGSKPPKTKAQKKIDQKIVDTNANKLIKKIIQQEKEIKVTTAPKTQLKGKVKLGKQLGAGQFNVVHKAQRGKADKFAVKCMKMNYVPREIPMKSNESFSERNQRLQNQCTEQTREAMIHEGKIAKEICRQKDELPYVIPIYEVRILKGKDEGACIVTTKLCEKGDLQKYSETKLKDKPKQQAQILLELFKGQKNLHDAGIVHRDIKLSNMLLTKKGTALVGDIGHAYKMNENIPYLPVTNFSILPPIVKCKLTEDYIKPRSAAPIVGAFNYLQDPKNDSFAFGILMCNLLRNAQGQGAFNADNHGEALAALSWLKWNPQTDMPQCEAEISEFIDETPFHSNTQKKLVQKLLLVDPENIPSDTEILATLEEILKELSL